MDGSFSDRLTGENSSRRLRPVTYDYAITNFPRLIVLLKTNNLQISVSSQREGMDILTLSRPRFREDKWVLLRSDFEIVRKIALDSSLKIFPSDTMQEIQKRILAKVEIEFENRKI